MSLARIFNKMWLYSQSGNHKEFVENISNYQEFQYEKLQSYLTKNKDTGFGRKYEFSKIRSYEAYQNLVPIIEDFKSIQPLIDDIANGKNAVLTSESVLFFENTSGSSGPSKWIPYTPELKKEFQKAVAAWMIDTSQQIPAAFKGKSFWSISPPFKAVEKTTSGIQVGISSDDAYFNFWDSFLINQIQAAPAHKLKTTNAFDFYTQLSQQLLSNDSLSFLSVWSPNYLLQLDQFMIENWSQILRNVGTKRSDYLKGIGPNSIWSERFPDLTLVSCWTESQAAVWLAPLQERLGNIPIQPKGLLSTEGVTTIPFQGKNVLAYTSHFYEFRNPVTQDIFLPKDLELGTIYEVVLTTGGGLYRHNTHDLVKVTSKDFGLPGFRFLGKSHNTSDLAGEKISEHHLVEIFEQLIGNQPLEIHGLYLQPKLKGQQIVYELLIETKKDNSLTLAVDNVEKVLFENPYYHQALKVGQILPLTGRKVEYDFGEKLFRYYQVKKQMKDGDVKLPLLYPLHFLDDLLSNLPLQ